MTRNAGRCAKARQQGTVLLLVTFSLLAILAFAALALDISRMYIIKSQLQNAADAGALRAAKALDGTGSGVQASLDKGIESALTNSFLLVSEPLAAGDITVEVATDPAGPWTDAASASGSGSNDYYFARVTTSKQGIGSFFGGLLGVLTGAARAVAIAGSTQLNITPLAVCAPDWAHCPKNDPAGTCGLVPGLGYLVGDLNPVGPGTMFWIDPVATAAPCTMTNANDTRPYVCVGKIAINPTTRYVMTNTGITTPQLAALDSRFGDYAPSSQCDPATAPPDPNVMQYLCASSGGHGDPCLETAKSGARDQIVADWMSSSDSPYVNPDGTAPVQASTVLNRTVVPMQVDPTGITWSFRRPEAAPITGRSHGANANYPGAGLTPYTASGSKYWASPASGTPGTPCPNRRVLNVVVVHCESAGGVCRQAEVGGIAQFLMTRKARGKSDNNVYLEFGGMSRKNVIAANIKLYR